MAQNPKYDNDMVNLGYLNKRLGQTEESINKNNNSISQIPKNYSTPPNPPYYKDSLLCYGNKIYRCNTTKLNGTFSWNDWTIVATDDTTLSDFIKNTYEIEKLEIQEQIDGKVQTHYQENDPSKDWTTDLEKGRHVGDYWYNTENDTQWRYNQITTGPTITYGWGQVNVPRSVFDMIDTKKSIYTEKPTSYKKDDLWIIEETLSDEDLPVGTEENPIAKGDWVFSIADSEVYNKEHWVKRDEDVPLSYLKQHYYTITEIDSSLEVIERNTESKITKATEEISLNVSQTYTTKEQHTSAINDFDEQIGTINQTITEHKETLSDLSVEVGKVSASVESVETRTEELLVDVNGVKENIIPTATATGSNIYIEDASDNPLINLEIEGKSMQDGKPTADIPIEIKSVGSYNEETGKYGIEVKTEGKNKLDYKTCSPITDGTVEIGEDKIKFITNTSSYGVQFPEMILKANTTYSMYCDYSFTGSMTQWGVRVGINGKWTPVNDNNLVVFTTDETGIIIPAFYVGLPYTISGDVLELSNIRIYEGLYSKDTIPKYELYQKNTSVIVLNEPLRSLPNGVRDKAYIKNNKLYVDRCVGSRIFDGSETDWIQSTVNGIVYFYINLPNSIDATSVSTQLLSNYFKPTNNNNSQNDFYHYGHNIIVFNHGIATTLQEFKTWLSTHNTEVIYELAEPYTEELGEIEMPSTFKGIDNITTTDDLEPTINIEYVRDTVLSKYVEGQIDNLKTIEERHYAELTVEDDRIRMEVGKKVNNDAVIAAINLSSEEATINAEKISLEGKKFNLTSDEITIESDNFSVTKEGKITSTSGIIGGFEIKDDRFSNEISTTYNFTEEDLNKVRNYIVGNTELTPKQIEIYDINGDGVVDLIDQVRILKMINEVEPNTIKGTIEINSKSSQRTLVLRDENGNILTSIGLNGITTSSFSIDGSKVYGEIVLYEGSSNEDISLNDDVSNYEYIEIFYRDQDQYSSLKISDANGKYANLNVIDYDNGSNGVWDKFKKILISENTIQNQWYGEIGLHSSAVNSSTNTIYITKVIGYK